MAQKSVRVLKVHFQTIITQANEAEGKFCLETLLFWCLWTLSLANDSSQSFSEILHVILFSSSKQQI